MDSSSNVPTVTAPEKLLGYTLNLGPVSDGAGSQETVSLAGSFTSSLTSAATDRVYASVSFNRFPPQSPPAQTINVLANPQGTVTHSTGALTAGDPVLGNGGGDVKIGAAGQLVPAGGSAGQVLAKNSGTDFDTAWATNPSGDVSGEQFHHHMHGAGERVHSRDRADNFPSPRSLRSMSQINLNNTTPAAPGGNVNITFQKDASNNISGYVPTASSAAFIGASAYNAGTLTISSGTPTKLSFDTNNYDTSSIHSTSVNPTRFTAPQTGYYLLSAGANFTSAPGFFDMSIYINGSQTSTPFLFKGGSSTSANTGPTAAAVFHLTSGDYVEFSVFTSNSNTLTAGPAYGQMSSLGV